MNKKLKTQNSKFKIRRGFTLVEMILYVAIVSIFVTAMIEFALNIVYGRVKSYTQQEVNQNMRLAGKRINFEIRNATGVNSVSASSVNLAVSDSARNPTVIGLNGGRLTIGYGVSGSCPTTAPCNLTSNLVNVSNLTFSDLSVSPFSTNIRFSITIESSGSVIEQQYPETYAGAAELRSK